MYKRGIDGYTYDEDHSVYQEVDGFQFFDVVDFDFIFHYLYIIKPRNKAGRVIFTF